MSLQGQSTIDIIKKHKNTDLAKSFLHYACCENRSNFKELVGVYKESKNAVNQYQHIEADLTKEGGGLNN